ncbi:MAG: C25 family cysteine peptidase [Candidatus Eisenbacteria bacterium]|nr:C25 family cysteine peptidase [Candidatus Eisenbacteria bacterium]
MAAISIGVAGAGVHQVEVRFDPAAITRGVRMGVDGAAWLLPGCSVWNEAGAPAVPFRPVLLAVPAGERVVSVTTRASGASVELDLGEPGIGSTDGRRAPTAWDGATPYPARLHRSSDAGWMRGQQIQPLTIWPLDWDPGRGLATLTTSILIEMVTEAAPPPADTFLPLRPSARVDGHFGALLSSCVLNPELLADESRRRDVIRPLDSAATPFSPRFRPSVDGSPVEMVIITSEALEPYFTPLAVWKTERGIPTVVRSTEWIRANYPNAVDLASTIRRFIADAASRWGTEYVLLAGGSEIIPVRYGKSLYFGGEDIPADMYYQCLDGTWNSDGDAFFGEGYNSSLITGDGCDLFPEVWLGRAAVSDSTTAQTFVSKNLTYERDPAPGYLTRAMMMAEVLFPQHYSTGDSIVYDGAYVAEQALSRFPPSFTLSRYYENFPPYAPLGALPETKTAVVDAVNSGYGIIQHVGHGYINTMAVGIDGLTLGNPDVAAFSNGPRYSLLYSINCTSAAFDFNCIGEEWLENATGGAVANVGSTRFDFPGTGTEYQNEFYRVLFGAPVPSLGEAFAGSKIPFIAESTSDSEHRWTQFAQVLLGDPSLRIWRYEPVAAAVSHPSSIELGAGVVVVTVMRGGSPVDSAVVCLFKNSDDYVVALTDGAGQATLDFHPDRPGQSRLTVTHPTLRPWQSDIAVLAPALPHLFASLAVVDDATAPADGNGDTIFDLEETVRFELVLTNQGTAPATLVTATLVSADPNLQIIDGTASWPSLGVGASAPPIDPFVIRAVGTATDRYETTATLIIAAAGYSRSEPVIILVGAPLLERYRLLRSDVGLGNGNGLIEVGENQTLTLTLRNNGRGAVRNVTARLRPLGPETTISDSMASFGTIGADQVAIGDPFVFQWSTINPSRKMRLVVESLGKTLMSFDVDVYPPGTPVLPAAGGKASSIALTWQPNIELDNRGYVVYRGTAAGGPFARVNMYADNRIAYYNDENLAPLTRFYYRVASIDQSGNESPQSIVAAATTTLSSSAGYPLLLGGSTSSSPTFSYFDGDTIPEIVCGAEELYVISGLGIEFVDGDNDGRTYGVYSSSGYATFWSPPSSTDIDLDGVIDVCAAGWSNGLLYLYDGHLGTKPGFPVNIDVSGTGNPGTWSAPVMVDVDGDDVMEIFINSGAHTYAFHADGSELVDGDANPATQGVFAALGAPSNYSTPRIVDLDNNGVMEVIIASRDRKLYVKHLNGTNYPGFPITYTGDITSTPAIGDLNNDGLKEIVFGCSDNKLYAFNINKVAPPGWPKGVNFNQDLDSSPALADMNGDGFLDVAICAGNGTVGIFKGQDGGIFPGFPVILTNGAGQSIQIRSSPSIGNVDTSPDLEMVFGGQDGNVYALKTNGTMAIGFPIKTDNVVEGGAVLWDVDGDGLTEVCVQSFDQRLYVWDTPAPFTAQSCPWPMFGHDSRRTGVVGNPIFIVTGTPDSPPAPPLPLTLAQNSPNPFQPATTIRFRVAPDSNVRSAQLAVFDPSGRLVRRLFEGEVAAGEFEFRWDGLDDAGCAVGSGVYFYRIEANGQSITRKMVLAR